MENFCFHNQRKVWCHVFRQLDRLTWKPRIVTGTCLPEEILITRMNLSAQMKIIWKIYWHWKKSYFPLHICLVREYNQNGLKPAKEISLIRVIHRNKIATVMHFLVNCEDQAITLIQFSPLGWQQTGKKWRQHWISWFAITVINSRSDIDFRDLIGAKTNVSKMKGGNWHNLLYLSVWN